jgi:hypothetical protein
VLKEDEKRRKLEASNKKKQSRMNKKKQTSSPISKSKSYLRELLVNSSEGSTSKKRGQHMMSPTATLKSLNRKLE